MSPLASSMTLESLHRLVALVSRPNQLTPDDVLFLQYWAQIFQATAQPTSMQVTLRNDSNTLSVEGVC